MPNVIEIITLEWGFYPTTCWVSFECRQNNSIHTQQMDKHHTGN